MNKIMDWFKNLAPEMMILLILVIVILFVLIVVLIRANKIFSAIAKKTMVVKEDFLLEEGKYSTRVTVTNIGYVNSVVTEIGFIYKKTKLPLVVDTINLSARESYLTSIDIEQLRSFILGSNNKVKKFHVYTIDALNRVTKKKMKLSYKYIANEIKQENKALKLAIKKERRAKRFAAKEQRYETGDYNFGDRMVLFLEALTTPFRAISRWSTKGINNMLRKREIKKEVKANLKEEQRAQLEVETVEKETEMKDKFQDKYSNKMEKKEAKKKLKLDKKALKTAEAEKKHAQKLEQDLADAKVKKDQKEKEELEKKLAEKKKLEEIELQKIAELKQLKEEEKVRQEENASKESKNDEQKQGSKDQEQEVEILEVIDDLIENDNEKEDIINSEK